MKIKIFLALFFVFLARSLFSMQQPESAAQFRFDATPEALVLVNLLDTLSEKQAQSLIGMQESEVSLLPPQEQNLATMVRFIATFNSSWLLDERQTARILANLNLVQAILRSKRTKRLLNEEERIILINKLVEAAVRSGSAEIITFFENNGLENLSCIFKRDLKDELENKEWEKKLIGYDKWRATSIFPYKY